MLSTVLFAVLLCCRPRVRGKLWCARRRCSDTRSYTPAALLTIIPPPTSSDSVPALVTQYINGLFLLFMESLSEKIKLERIRNIKECAGKQHLVREPWWTFCWHLLKGKRSTTGYCQWTLNLEALGTSVWFGRYALIFKDSVSWLTVRLGAMRGGRRERGRARLLLVVVEPASLKVLLGQCRSAPSTEQAPNESVFNRSNEWMFCLGSAQLNQKKVTLF